MGRLSEYDDVELEHLMPKCILTGVDGTMSEEYERLMQDRQKELQEKVGVPLVRKLIDKMISDEVLGEVEYQVTFDKEKRS